MRNYKFHIYINIVIINIIIVVVVVVKDISQTMKLNVSPLK